MGQLLVNNQLIPIICVLTVVCIYFLPGIKCNYEDGQCFASKSSTQEDFEAHCTCYRKQIKCFLRSLTSYSNFWPLFGQVKQPYNTVHLEVDHYSDVDSFTYFPSKLLNSLSAFVEELTLSTWRFQSIPPFTVPTNCSLKFFEIITNENLTKIESLAFSRLPKTLTRLSLTSNSIDTIETKAFKGLTSLVELELTSNLISALPDQVFSDLSSLTNLSLKSNKMATIRKETFTGLTRLLELELNHNQLITITNDTFYHMKNLRLLDLSRNQIDYLQPAAFNGLISVEFIDLSDNSLRYLPKDLLKYTKNLMDIDLKHNHLENLDHSFLDQLPKTVYLKDNPFACDCNMLNFVDRLMVNNEKTICLFADFNESGKISRPKKMTFKEYTDHVFGEPKLHGRCKEEIKPDLAKEKRSNVLRVATVVEDNSSSGQLNQPILVNLIVTLMISLFGCKRITLL